MTERPTVVVAEDESLIRIDLVEMLSDLGYEVVGQAGDGETAVELVMELHPDIALLDIKMPKLDGLTAAERIAGSTAVVMLTAFSQRELVEKARDAGVMAYLVKPFSPTDLAPTLELARARFAESRSLAEEISDLQQRLEARKVIERAKSQLSTSLGLSESEAFEWIRKSAMDRRTTMAAVAEVVLKELPGKPPENRSS